MFIYIYIWKFLSILSPLCVCVCVLSTFNQTTACIDVWLRPAQSAAWKLHRGENARSAEQLVLKKNVVSVIWTPFGFIEDDTLPKNSFPAYSCQITDISFPLVDSKHWINACVCVLKIFDFHYVTIWEVERPPLRGVGSVRRLLCPEIHFQQYLWRFQRWCQSNSSDIDLKSNRPVLCSNLF